MTDPADFQRIEETLARLDRELRDTRRALAALRAAQAEADIAATPADAPATPPLPPHAPPPHAPPPGEASGAPRQPRPAASGASAGRASPDAEQLIGRYGALTLAVVTILMGAGALVSWALREGLLTPWVRVALGAVLAAGLAGAGLAMRSRANRPFGHMLLALALAVIHVVAWGAGPQLELVPVWVSLAIADAASIALSMLALRDDHEALFAVGVGGALLAPFVQRSGAEHYVVLAAYGVVVSTAALRTIAARPWDVAGRLVVLSTFAYVVALGGYHGGSPLLERGLAPGFALLLSAAALVLLRPPLRSWMTVALLAALLATDVSRARGETALAMLAGAPDQLLLALGGAALALYAARGFLPSQTGWWAVGALALPSYLLLRVMFALAPARGTGLGGAVHAGVAGLWSLGYIGAALNDTGERRGVLLTTAGILATWVAVLAVDGWPDALPAACAVVAIGTAWMAHREEQPLILLATLAAATVGFAQGTQRVASLPGFGVPFISGPSLALALGVAGFMVAARLAPETEVRNLSGPRTWRNAALTVLAVGCFLWWRFELSRAFSADAAMFLLIVYYAASGVLVLWRGRVTGSRALRQAGLALSVVAALTALGGAFAVQQIALRVGSYLAVGAFLLGVAWWYRSAGERTSA